MAPRPRWFRELGAVLVAAALSGCVVIGPFEGSPDPAFAPDASAGEQLSFERAAATRLPDCGRVRNMTANERLLLGPTHASGPGTRSGAEAVLRWASSPDLLEEFRLEVRWTAASMLTKRLHVDFTYSPELKDLQLEGLSPLTATIVIEDFPLTEGTRAVVSPSTHELAVGSGGPGQIVQLELTQTYRRC